MWPVQAKDKTELKKIIEVLHFKMAENSMAYARSYVVRGKLYRRVDFFYHSSQSQLRQSRVEIICHYPLTSTVLVPVPVGSTLLSRNDLGLIDLAFSFHESLFFLFSQCPKLLIKPSLNKNSKPKVFRRKVLKKQKQSSFSESMAVETEKPSGMCVASVHRNATFAFLCLDI